MCFKRSKRLLFCIGLFVLLLQNKQTPLHVAAEGGHDEICKVLLEKGAQVDAKDNISGMSSEKGKSMISHIDDCLSLLCD